MPPVIVAAAGAALTSAVGGALAGTALTGIIAGAATSFVSAAASSLLQQAFAPSVKGSSGVKQTIRQATAFRQVVYGKRRVNGTIVYAGTAEGNRNILHMVIVWAGHECAGVDEIYMGSRKIWDRDDGGTAGFGGFSENVKVHNRLGAADQSVVQALVEEVEEWTTQHRLRGLTYSYIRLKYSRRLFPQGLTDISALVRGKKVYDPRDDSVGYSDNAALCLRDYLTDTDYGVGLTTSQISVSHVVAMANLADEDVSSVYDTDVRYRIGAVFDESASHRDVIEMMLRSMNGQGVWLGGQFLMSGGAYASPDVNFDEDDVTGPVQVISRRGVRDRYNQVYGVHLRQGSGGSSFIEGEYNPLTSDTFEAEDGEELRLQYDLPWSPGLIIARRIARVQLLRSRQEISLTVPVTLRGFLAVSGGSCRLSLARYGWTEKVFEVVGWTFQAGAGGAPGVALELIETSAAVWDWNTDDDEEDIAGDPTNLPDAFEVDAPLITLTDELVAHREEAITTLIATVDTEDETVVRHELAARRSGDSFWRPMAGATDRFELVNVEDGKNYEVRGRSFNALGVDSDYTIVSRTILGKTARPENVTGFRVEVLAESALLAWNPVGDPDLSHYEVRYSDRRSGVTYSGSSTIIKRVPRPATTIFAPARSGTYSIKAVDKQGRTSANAAFALSPISQVGSLNRIYTAIESGSFPGFKVDMLENDDALLLARADTGERVDDLGPIDDLDTMIDNHGAGAVLTPGRYKPNDTLDLGAIYAVRLQSDAKTSRLEYGATVDEFDLPIDEYEEPWDVIGLSTAEDDVSVEFEIRMTDDDPSGSPTWTEWAPFAIGDYTARAFQRRLIAMTDSEIATPQITEISFVADMRDRTEAAAGVASGVGSKAITFSAAFYAVPIVVISPSDLPQGGSFELTASSATGFAVIFRNSGGSAIDVDFSWTAYGYGARQ